MKKINSMGFGAAGLLLVILLLAIIGFAGWKIYDANKTSPLPTPNSTSPTQSTNEKSKVPEGFVVYENKELGLKFAYPKDWGEVTASKQNASVKGYTATFQFTNQKMMNAGVISKDYQSGGKDGACYINLGFYPSTSLAQIKQYTKDGDVASEDPTYKATNKILKTDVNTFIYEHFEAGEVKALGACPGLSVNGYKLFAPNSNLTGIQFFWGAQEGTMTPISEFANYKAAPNNYLSEQNRQDIIKVVSSAEAF